MYALCWFSVQMMKNQRYENLIPFLFLHFLNNQTEQRKMMINMRGK